MTSYPSDLQGPLVAPGLGGIRGLLTPASDPSGPGSGYSGIIPRRLEVGECVEQRAALEHGKLPLGGT